MKLTIALLTAAFLPASSLLAQNAVAPTTADQAPAAASEPLDVPLIPEEVKQNEKPKGSAIDQPGGKKSKTDSSEADLQQRIHFREAKTKALRDPKVQAEWDRSVSAKTDLERRNALKSYYKLLYAKIVKLDGSLKTFSDLRQASSLRRLEQTRIDPTIPIDPNDR